MNYLDLLPELRAIVWRILRMGDRHWLARTCKVLLTEDGWRSTRLPDPWLVQLAIDRMTNVALYLPRRHFFWLLHAEGAAEWPFWMQCFDFDHLDPIPRAPLSPGWSLSTMTRADLLYMGTDHNGVRAQKELFVGFFVTWPIAVGGGWQLDAPAFWLSIRLPVPYVIEVIGYESDSFEFRLPLAPEDGWVTEALQHLVMYLSTPL
jgi:hypothetical protein